MAHQHMAHQHNHEPSNNGRAFAFGVALNLGFVGFELICGQAAGSLSLIGDAAHNFSDVFALLLAWGASILVRRRATPHYTYGMRRTSILAALINACLLLVVTGAIGLEAIRRLSQSNPVSGGTVVGVAALGIVINTATALMFAAGRKHDLNQRAAFQHMAADALVAAGVVVSGVLIALTGWQWIDPVMSLIIAAILLISTWHLLRESLDLALDAVPDGIDTLAVQNYLLDLPGVQTVHDLHIWAMSTTETALTAHLVMSRDPDNSFLRDAAGQLHDQFGIEHTTLQIETDDPGYECESCPPLISSTLVETLSSRA